MITTLTVPYFGGHVAISRCGGPEDKIVPQRIEAYCMCQGDNPRSNPFGNGGIGNCQPFAIKNVFVSDERSPTLDRSSKSAATYVRSASRFSLI